MAGTNPDDTGFASSNDRLLQRRKAEAQKDETKNLKILREIRDDKTSKPSERLAAIAKIDEIGFDKTPSREPEKSFGDKKIILLGLPTLDMLKRVATSNSGNSISG